VYRQVLVDRGPTEKRGIHSAQDQETVIANLQLGVSNYKWGYLTSLVYR